MRLLFLLLLILFSASLVTAQENRHLVQIGDTWVALAQRHDMSVAQLQEMNGVVNRSREPIIGSELVVPQGEIGFGRITRPTTTLTLHALTHNTLPADLITTNQLSNQWLIPFQAVTIDSDKPIREYPVGYNALELSHNAAVRGQAVAFRAQRTGQATATVTLESPTFDPLPFDLFSNGSRQVGLRGTGAFYALGAHDLTIQVADAPLWSQPWRFVDDQWEWQQITFTGAAANISNEAIREERARLFEIWERAIDTPLWSAEFVEPIADFVAYSSGYGARRSYDGGVSYNTYHEGVDYAAYEGTDVWASAGGVIVVAEPLYVRGGAVIINHGLGIYSGYYHLSDVVVNRGDIVQVGQKVGEVGTTGLSTGNHLHWDFLVTETWVGADSWVEQGMGCWVLEGLGKRCD